MMMAQHVFQKIYFVMEIEIVAMTQMKWNAQ